MVKRRWKDVISGQDRAQINAHNIQLMLKSPANILRQLKKIGNWLFLLLE